MCKFERHKSSSLSDPNRVGATRPPVLYESVPGPDAAKRHRKQTQETLKRWEKAREEQGSSRTMWGD